MSYPEETNYSVLEQELRSLRPLPPDPEFMLRLNRRMEQAMAGSRPTATAQEENRPLLPFPAAKSALPWRKIVPWAAAAAVTAVATQAYQSPETASNTVVESKHSRIQKVIAAGRQMREVQEEGIQVDPQHGAHRSIRFQFNNSFQLEDQAGQRLDYHYPSEERMVIPVKFY